MNKDRIAEIISTVFQVPEEKVQPSVLIRDLPNWDSIKHLMLISSIEEEFGKVFSDKDLIDMHSVNDISNVLERDWYDLFKFYI